MDTDAWDDRCELHTITVYSLYSTGTFTDSKVWASEPVAANASDAEKEAAHITQLLDIPRTSQSPDHTRCFLYEAMMCSQKTYDIQHLPAGSQGGSGLMDGFEVHNGAGTLVFRGNAAWGLKSALTPDGFLPAASHCTFSPETRGSCCDPTLAAQSAETRAFYAGSGSLQLFGALRGRARAQ
jgi:hypothetical protein